MLSTNETKSIHCDGRKYGALNTISRSRFGLRQVYHKIICSLVLEKTNNLRSVGMLCFSFKHIQSKADIIQPSSQSFPNFYTKLRPTSTIFHTSPSALQRKHGSANIKFKAITFQDKCFPKTFPGKIPHPSSLQHHMYPTLLTHSGCHASQSVTQHKTPSNSEWIYGSLPFLCALWRRQPTHLRIWQTISFCVRHQQREEKRESIFIPRHRLASRARGEQENPYMPFAQGRMLGNALMEASLQLKVTFSFQGIY